MHIAGADIFHDQPGTDGPAIVLVHGGMCDHHDWDRMLPSLAAKHTVVRLDLRGHGRSTGDAADCTVEHWAADVLALIAALGLAPAILVGHSLASRIVAEAAVQNPGAVAGLVLLDGSRGHGGKAAAPASIPQPAPDLAAIIELTIGPYADAAARKAIAATMASTSPAIMAACVSAMREWDLGRADAVFAALAGALPVLAIQSTYHDPATARHSFERSDQTSPYLDFLGETVPQLEVATFTRTGHFSMVEKPEATAQLIVALASRAASHQPITDGGKI